MTPKKRPRGRPRKSVPTPPVKRRKTDDEAVVAYGSDVSGTESGTEEQIDKEYNKNLKKFITSDSIKKLLMQNRITPLGLSQPEKKKFVDRRLAFILDNIKYAIQIKMITCDCDAVTAAVLIDREIQILQNRANTRLPQRSINSIKAIFHEHSPNAAKAKVQQKAQLAERQRKYRIPHPNTSVNYTNRDNVKKTVTINRLQQHQNIYLRSGDIAKIECVRRSRAKKKNSKSVIIYNKGGESKTTTLEYSNDNIDEEDDSKAEQLLSNGDVSMNIEYDGDEEIKFRVGDIVRYKNDDYKIHRMFRQKIKIKIVDDVDDDELDDDELEHMHQIVNRFELQHVDDHNLDAQRLVICDYDNDDELLLIKKNIHYIDSTVCTGDSVPIITLTLFI